MGGQWEETGVYWEVMGGQWEVKGVRLDVMGGQWEVMGVGGGKGGFIGRSLELSGRSLASNGRSLGFSGRALGFSGSSWQSVGVIGVQWGLPTGRSPLKAPLQKNIFWKHHIQTPTNA